MGQKKDMTFKEEQDIKFVMGTQHWKLLKSLTGKIKWCKNKLKRLAK